MPEEINRILTDHVSTLLFCPTATAVSNLELEGLTDCVFNVGDVMCDVASVFQGEAARSEGIINRLELNGKRFALATCHRAENTDDMDRMHSICLAFEMISNEIPIIFPLHPRTQNVISTYH